MKPVSWRIVGLTCFAPTIAMLAPLAVALANGQGRAAWGFGLGVLTALATAALCLRNTPNPDRSLATLLGSMAAAWLIVPAIGALPFLAVWSQAGWSGALVADALFESMSGFTSCGLTIVADPSELPASIQLWRSISQWVGGIGIAAVMLAALNPAADAGRMLRTEVGTSFRGGPNAALRWIWASYAVGTALAIGAFWSLGMPSWEALNHGLTAISTGGFTITSDSMASYSAAIQVVATILMLLGATSFAYFHRVATARKLHALRNPQLVLLLVGAVGATALLVGLAQRDGETEPLLSAWFQAVSAVCTGGFGSADLSAWSLPALTVLALCMFIGGESGSTAGGLKLDRALLIGRGILWRLKRGRTTAETERVVVVQRERLREDQARLEVESAATLTAVWIAATGVASLALWFLVPPSTGFEQVVFEVLSALSSVGLSAGVTSPDLDSSAKLALAALMWFGRLELFGGLYLLMRVRRS